MADTIRDALKGLVEAVYAYENGCRDSCDIWRSVNALDCTCGYLDLKDALTAARSALEAQPDHIVDADKMVPAPAEGEVCRWCRYKEKWISDCEHLFKELRQICGCGKPVKVVEG